MPKSKHIFSIAKNNAPVEGCTVSEKVLQGGACSMSVFSIAAGTNISPESYDYPKIWKIEEGSAEVLYLTAETQALHKGGHFYRTAKHSRRHTEQNGMHIFGNTFR